MSALTPELEARYDHWRLRHLYSTFVGYAIYYFEIGRAHV